MVLRQTLARDTALEGVGLHSGRPVRMRLVPAAAETGIVFVRTDLGRARIPATLEHVGPSFYATVLEAEGARVGTIEHLMAALCALRIDDLEVEVDGPELPIMDGSSRPFVEAIERAGPVELPTPRLYMNLTRPVIVTHEDKRVAAYPAREFRVTYAIDFEHPMLRYQELSVGLWSEGAFAQKLAPARTFTFEGEVEALRKRGLALGGSLDNALVLAENRVLNPALRFKDEFVRHKILDLTGDLALLGRPLRAHVVAYRAGHDLHLQLAQQIGSRRDAWYLGTWSEQPLRAEGAVGG
jgi:UDP-3-O-[3-hydroxymyristoyl] N-acetylglucosamine deacetylase